MTKTTTPVFGMLAALADPTRSRLILLLEGQPLSVSELCAVLQLPQSTVSRHLKVLADEGWASARAEGASRVYRVSRLEPTARRLWDGVRGEVAGLATSQQDQVRLRAVLDERRRRSAAFFAASAGQWEALRRDLFGAREMLPLLALLGPDWVVGDLGCGAGHVAGTLAPFVRKVIGVDASAEMIDLARERLAGMPNVEVRRGQLEDVPIESSELDVALLMLVLHYIVDPARVLVEAARVLRPGGQLLVVDMVPHDRADYQETMGHVWQGFSAEELDAWMNAAGLVTERRIELAPDPGVRGPNLFAAVARRK